jgi:hypothetical protein
MNMLNTIFILGYPRSGTTWFANLFNSHPDVAYRHEVIGRCYSYFPAQLFHDLKHNNGLVDKDYEKALDIILSPNVESDRAPFFHKNHLRIESIRLHYLFWIAAKTLKPLGFIYKYFFYPDKRGLALVIKETRSTVNMDSMLTGLRADKVVILFRHPCGALASSLRGIETGKMTNSTEDMRRCWYQENIHKSYLKGLDISEDDIAGLPEHRYLAILWAQQNEDYLEFSSAEYEKLFISYEAFMHDKERKIRSLFTSLSLDYDPRVEDFIRSTSGSSDSRPVMKDSSSNFYSVYRDQKFDPEKWKKDLPADQISDIEQLTMDTYKRLLDNSFNGE